MRRFAELDITLALPVSGGNRNADRCNHHRSKQLLQVTEEKQCHKKNNRVAKQFRNFFSVCFRMYLIWYLKVDSFISFLIKTFCRFLFCRIQQMNCHRLYRRSYSCLSSFSDRRSFPLWYTRPGLIFRGLNILRQLKHTVEIKP